MSLALTALKLKDKSYLMRLGEQCYIDAKDNLNCLARYINDCRNPSGYNVTFLKLPNLKIAKIIAIKTILKNEEIFVNYGKWYWIGSNIIPKKLTFKQLYYLKLNLNKNYENENKYEDIENKFEEKI